MKHTIRARVLAIIVLAIIRCRAAGAVLRSVWADLRYAGSNARMVWELSVIGQCHDFADKVKHRHSCHTCGEEVRAGMNECDDCRFGDLPM